MKTEKLRILVIDNDIFIIRKLLFISGFIFLITGIAIFSLDWRNFGSLVILASIIAFGIFYWINEKYKEYKAIYIHYLPEEDALEMLHYGSFKFTNDCLVYCSRNINREIKWTELLGYKLISSTHIALFRRNIKEHNLIISKTEMDSADFQKAFEFIKQKVRKYPFYHNHIIN